MGGENSSLTDNFGLCYGEYDMIIKLNVSDHKATSQNKALRATSEVEWAVGPRSRSGDQHKEVKL